MMKHYDFFEQKNGLFFKRKVESKFISPKSKLTMNKILNDNFKN